MPAPRGWPPGPGRARSIAVHHGDAPGLAFDQRCQRAGGGAARADAAAGRARPAPRRHCALCRPPGPGHRCCRRGSGPKTRGVGCRRRLRRAARVGRSAACNLKGTVMLQPPAGGGRAAPGQSRPAPPGGAVQLLARQLGKARVYPGRAAVGDGVAITQYRSGVVLIGISFSSHFA